MWRRVAYLPPGTSVFFVLADTAPLLQVGVQLLYFRRGNLVERPVAEGGLDVEGMKTTVIFGLEVSNKWQGADRPATAWCASGTTVGLERAGAHSAYHVLVQPTIQPLTQCHGTVLGQVYPLVDVDLLPRAVDRVAKYENQLTEQLEKTEQETLTKLIRSQYEINSITEGFYSLFCGAEFEQGAGDHRLPLW